MCSHTEGGWNLRQLSSGRRTSRKEAPPTLACPHLRVDSSTVTHATRRVVVTKALVQRKNALRASEVHDLGCWPRAASPGMRFKHSHPRGGPPGMRDSHTFVNPMAMHSSPRGAGCERVARGTTAWRADRAAARCGGRLNVRGGLETGRCLMFWGGLRLRPADRGAEDLARGFWVGGADRCSAAHAAREERTRKHVTNCPTQKL